MSNQPPKVRLSDVQRYAFSNRINFWVAYQIQLIVFDVSKSYMQLVIARFSYCWWCMWIEGVNAFPAILQRVQNHWGERKLLEGNFFTRKTCFPSKHQFLIQCFSSSLTNLAFYIMINTAGTATIVLGNSSLTSVNKRPVQDQTLKHVWWNNFSMGKEHQIIVKQILSVGISKDFQVPKYRQLLLSLHKNIIYVSKLPHI